MTPTRATQVGITAFIVAVFVAFIVLIAGNDPLRAAHESGEYTEECTAVLEDFHADGDFRIVQENFLASQDQPDPFVYETARDEYYQGFNLIIDYYATQEALSDEHDRYLYYMTMAYSLIADMTYEAFDDDDEIGVDVVPPAARWYADQAREYVEGVACLPEG